MLFISVNYKLSWIAEFQYEGSGMVRIFLKIF